MPGQDSQLAPISEVTVPGGASEDAASVMEDPTSFDRTLDNTIRALQALEQDQTRMEHLRVPDDYATTTLYVGSGNARLEKSMTVESATLPTETSVTSKQLTAWGDNIKGRMMSPGNDDTRDT